jgi:hypothetical protein
MKQEPTDNASPVESLSIVGASGIVWQPTDRFLESLRTEQGRGGCQICREEIVGEDARYYEHTERHTYYVADKIKTSERQVAIRRHFILKHQQGSIKHSRVALDEPAKVIPLPTSPQVVKEPATAELEAQVDELQRHVIYMERELVLARHALERLWKQVDIKAQAAFAVLPKAKPTSLPKAKQTAKGRKIRHTVDNISRASWNILFDEEED